jgi:S-adenosylmethionine synthetase
MANTSKAVVTGASGLLGRALMRELSAAEGFETTGLSFSRAGNGLVQLDLCDDVAVSALLRELRPAYIVHSAAIRQPDICDHQPERTHQLNVAASARLAQLAAEIGAWLIYISTDYVFDGTAPPYNVDSVPNPINTYGHSKVGGEEAVSNGNTDAAVLRVPILYGQIESLEESAVTIVAQAWKSNKPLGMDHWATRYPTYVNDVAVVCRQLLERKGEDPNLRGIFHWSGDEAMTKYEISRVIADILGKPQSQLEQRLQPPDNEALRPRDCHLDCSRLEALGIGQRTPFREALTQCLSPYQ